MKKALVLLLLGALALPLFADDALVMPERVLRIYVVPAYGFMPGYYDDDGKYEKYDSDEGAVSFFSLGFAAEYGINDWITAALQWTPMWNVWSSIDAEIYGNDQGNINGLYDLFLGAKLQIVGEKAPVANKEMRLAVAPGIIIPMPKPDWEDEQENLLDDDPFTYRAPDKHAWAFGSRFYFDYLFTPEFFVNLYSEILFYLETEDTDISDPTGEYDVGYGYRWTIEVEPQYVTMVADGMRLDAGLAANYRTWPNMTVDGDEVEDDEEGAGGYTFSLKPNVALFFLKSAVPMEFKLAYMLPLLGKMTRATHAISLEGRVYLKF